VIKLKIHTIKVNQDVPMVKLVLINL